MNLLVIAGLWYACGLGIVLNEMRYDMDVTLKWILYAAFTALLGPLWLVQTAERLKWFDLVILKHKSRK